MTTAVRPRRARVVLSREAIAATAMELTLEQPTTPLTLTALGALLGADPTALYRHYRSRDELMLDMADRMYGEVIELERPGLNWRESLTHTAHTIRDVFLRRPALAAEVGSRFTGGPNERQGVELLRAVLGGAGFPDDVVRVHVRAFGEMVLSHVVMTASMMTLSTDAQDADVAVAISLYGPDVAATSRDYEDVTFSSMLDTYLAGLASLRPRRVRKTAAR